MKNLAQKRKQSWFVIMATVFGSALIAAAPKTNLDSAKQIFLTVADVAMCMMIWDIYFGENLYQKKIKSILLELLFVILVIAITAYIISKGLTVLGDKLIIWLGIMGWGAIGLIAAVAACSLGVAWTLYCDDLYKN
jgi:hypothetical protein